jgi:HSP20 family molecular chaperone IbpA
MTDRKLVISGGFKERERTGVLRRSTRRTGRFACAVLSNEINAEGVEARLSEGVLSRRAVGWSGQAAPHRDHSRRLPPGR